MVEYRPQQFDRAIYDRRSGILRITARDALTVRMYCQGFGLFLFGEIGWFDPGGVLCFNPLLTHGRSAIVPTPGLTDVQLTELTLQLPYDHHRSRVIVRANDVLEVLAEYGAIRLRDGEIVGAKLRLRYASGGRPRKVELRAPNLVKYDWRRDEAITRTFLEERGFLSGPMSFEFRKAS